MRIYCFVEHYPSPYKSYFDTQFGEFLRVGHDLQVIAEGAHGPWERFHTERSLDTRTRYISRTQRGIAALPASSLLNALSPSGLHAGRFVRYLSQRPAGVRSIVHAVIGLLVPRAEPDLCLFHGLRAARHLTSLPALWPSARRCLYYHGGDVPNMPPMADEEVRELFASMHIVFTNTEDSRAHAIERGCPPGRIHVSPVGFDLEQFKPVAGRTYRGSGALRLLSIGRLSREKGTSFAIDAIQLLRSRGVQGVEYRIAGDGPLMATIQEQVRTLGLADSVTVLGQLPREQLLDELRTADALVLPSLHLGNWKENQACVAQEAMLMRLPVIATDAGGVPESIAPELRHLLVPPGNAEAIAERILQLRDAAGGELERLGERARQFVTARYDIRQLNAELLNMVMGTHAG